MLQPTGEGWERSLERAERGYGAHDPPPPVRKEHVYRWSRIAGAERVMYSRRARRLCGFGDEWRLPWWGGSKSRFARAIPVLKIINARVMTEWVLANRPDIRLIHLVRHPGGMLHSWLSRFVEKQGHDKVRVGQMEIVP